MSYFVIIKHMKVAKANVFACNYFISAIPLMAAHLFSHAMGIKAGSNNGRIAYIHHDAVAQAEMDRNTGFHKVVPHQRKAATYINADDYAGGSMSLSLQPVFTSDLEVSLVIEFDKKPDQDAVEGFLYAGRFAGGQIISYRELVVVHADSEEFEEHIPQSGYFIVDRSDMLETKDPVTTLIELLSEKHSIASNNAFLSPFVAGYALTTDPRSDIPGTRSLPNGEIPDHVFAEPMVGLAQFVSVRADFDSIPFWKGGWSDDSAYVLTTKTH